MFVMAGLVPATHALLAGKQSVDARHKAGHDVDGLARAATTYGISALLSSLMLLRIIST